jgi:hypothetical protein
LDAVAEVRRGVESIPLVGGEQVGDPVLDRVVDYALRAREGPLEDLSTGRSPLDEPKFASAHRTSKDLQEVRLHFDPPSTIP